MAVEALELFISHLVLQEASNVKNVCVSIIECNELIIMLLNIHCFGWYFKDVAHAEEYSIQHFCRSCV